MRKMKCVTDNPIFRFRWSDCLNEVFEIRADCLEVGEPIRLTLEYNGEKRRFTFKIDDSGEVHSWEEKHEDYPRFVCPHTPEYTAGCRDTQLRIRSFAKEAMEEHARKYHKAGWFR
jgi:hypothetical protein